MAEARRTLPPLNGNKNDGGVFEGYSNWQVMSLIEGFVRSFERKAVIRLFSQAFCVVSSTE
jgi:hypothetical protein